MLSGIHPKRELFPGKKHTGAPLLGSVSCLTCPLIHETVKITQSEVSKGMIFSWWLKSSLSTFWLLVGCPLCLMQLVLWAFESILCLWQNWSDIFQAVFSKSWWLGRGCEPCTFCSEPFSLSSSKTGRSVTMCCGYLLAHMLDIIIFFFPRTIFGIHSLSLEPFLYEIACGILLPFRSGWPSPNCWLVRTNKDIRNGKWQLK